MTKFLYPTIAFSLVVLALFADRLEVKYSGAGALLWQVFLFGSIVLLALQAKQTKTNYAICLVAFLPMLNLLLVPTCSVYMVNLSAQKPNSKTKTSKRKREN